MPKKVKEYPETHQQGIISIENEMPHGSIKGDIGIQIATDGRIWVCINGIGFIRFRPLITDKEKNNG